MAQLGKKKGKGKSTRALCLLSPPLFLSLRKSLLVQSGREQREIESGSVKCAKWSGRRREKKVASVQQL
jgi:hypothetical protein